MNPKKIYIIILQWNNIRYTIQCIQSVAKSNYRNFQIVLVDNCSSSEELSQLRTWTRTVAGGDANESDEWGPWCEVRTENDGATTIRSEAELRALGLQSPMVVILASHNHGFAEGNNLGIRYALQASDAEFVWLLNNDTEVSADALGEMVRAIMSDPSYGAVQSFLLNAFDHERIDSKGIGVASHNSVFDVAQGERAPDRIHQTENSVVEIFGTCAASALIRASVFESIGLLDSQYFGIFEDADFAFRLRLAGGRAALAAQSVVYHRRGISGQSKEQGESRKLRFLKMRNALALKIRFWPARLVFCNTDVVRVATKAIFLSFLERNTLGTLRFWANSFKCRLNLSDRRTAVFARWADVGCRNSA